jgi:hypothetical protein
MAKVTITFEDDLDAGVVDITTKSNPTPKTEEETTPAHQLATLVLNYLDRVMEAADDTTDEAA